jgi:hypothetical protein
VSSPGDRIARDRALGRKLRRYEVRFNDAFWEFLEAKVEPCLLDSPIPVDLGRGPGLFLRDVSHRLHKTKPHGLDTLVRAAVELPNVFIDDVPERPIQTEGFAGDLVQFDETDMAKSCLLKP